MTSQGLTNIALDSVIQKLQGLDRSELLSIDPEELQRIEEFLADETGRILDEQCRTDVLYWLQNHTKTNNPQYQALGLPYQSPFPRKDYFDIVFQYLASEKYLFIPKTRDMLTSLSICGFATHRAQWFKEETIFQTANEDKAGELVSYCVTFWENQDDGLKRLHPLKTNAKFELAWEEGGRAIGIPSGEDKIRMYHPTRYVMDEAAFLPEAQQCFEAASPVCNQIIGVSTAAPGWFGDQCSL